MAEYGLVVKGDDGSVYFLRPEVLAAAKVPADLHAHVNGQMKAGGGAKVVGTLDPNAEGDLAASGKSRAMKAPVTGDTIMCPW